MDSKAKQIITPEKKYEMAVQAEAELQRVIREQKTLESGFFGGDAKFTKQHGILDNLETEHNDLLTELFVAKAPTKIKHDENVITSILSLLDEHNVYDSEIQAKNRCMKEMNESIAEVRKKVIDMRTRVSSDNQFQKRYLTAQQTLGALENRLDTETKQYCTIVTENRCVRDEINHMLIERISFNKLWYGYIANLNKGKTFMMDIIEQATIAYDRRDEWVQRLNALRNRAFMDLQSGTTEMQAMKKKLDCDHELENFYTIKGQKRIMEQLEHKTLLERLRKHNEMKKCLTHYQKLLTEIKKFTGTNPETQAESFVNFVAEIEGRNMSMFSYITQLQTESEDLTRVIVQQHDDIDKQIGISAQFKSRQTNGVKSLKSQLVMAKKEADAANRELTATNAVLKQLFNGINKLFQICKCSNAPFIQLLYDNTKINNFNVFYFLQVLEDRVTVMLLTAYFNEKTGKKAKPESSVINEQLGVFPTNNIDQLIPTNPCPLCVDRELVSEVIDSLQCIHSRVDVEEKLLLRLTLPDALDRLHNVSACNLPKSRQIIQKRYQ